ncbi:MAG: hypothetical protein F6K25_20800 [Okeania sp. SIO2G4]|uniref:hypothetical protein n=1 Tax=unclassified Okeania TaxID=2634635 RepID=UPI0013BDDEBA|nr:MULTISPECIES: hypothetical protein [unclassified Okeania]NEP05905.1 hypothetical protein [Okeania sp. SIO4D6]NEP39376.1 hypothetical protein [Okeania sp. SIO2H7]NEP72576.1 hypothetical protein [Okeania sp. SIO2G5]NEP95395.1 hypothetical protein [Okeania sp. SIO2F5]NEQ92972.1 hypothetical protein [Okeania sp. SIO2G4]
MSNNNQSSNQENSKQYKVSRILLTVLIVVNVLSGGYFVDFKVSAMNVELKFEQTNPLSELLLEQINKK